MRRLLTFFCLSHPIALMSVWTLLMAAPASAQVITYSVSGYVFRDADGNGDPSEPDTPMAGVVIRLHSDPNADGNPSDGSLLATTATDSGGFYEFEAANGAYVIEQIDTPGTLSTYDTQGSLTDSLIAVTVSGSSINNRNFLDFGVQLFAISGSVFADGPSNDSLFGPDDQAVGAVFIRLYADLNADGLVGVTDTLIAEAVTGTNGRYGFGGLVPGRYVVREIDPNGAISVNDSQGAPTDNQIGITIVAGDVTNAHFLDQGITVATIRGAVRDDFDKDGDPADLDQPLVGVTLLLFTDPNADGNPFDGYPVSLAATNMQGLYEFPQLPPGNYVVFQFVPQGADSTWDAQGIPTDGMVGVALAGVTVTGRDFLVRDALIATGTGIVFEDGSNQNGLFTQDDAQVAGFEVRLYADLDGNTVVSSEDIELGTVTSTAGGVFTFARLVYGAYVAETLLPSGVSPVNDMAGAADDGQIGFELFSPNYPNLLFLNQGIALSSAAGSVRNDLDGDGDPSDTDPPLPNVPVQLFTDPNADGNPADGLLIASTVTNAQGNYQFSGLAARDYVLQVTNVLGATSTYDAEGSLTDNRIRLPLNGTTVTGRDFLNTGAILASISGFVFNEGPANTGGFSGDDLPLPGVFIRLYADANNNGIADLTDPLITTTATLRNGSYTLQGLPAGNYVIVELDPPGTSSLADSQGNPTDSTIAVTLAGTPVTGRNFLNSGATFSSIIGHVRDDFDSDGNLTDPDKPIPGVTIQLYIDLYSDGLLTNEDIFLEEAVTNTAGQFVFSNLPGGSYLLREIDPRGAISTGDTQGPNDNLVGIQITNANNTSAVFLNAYDPTGYLYDAVTGEILAGGSVSVSGPGAVTLVMNGTSGQYTFATQGTPGTYTISFTAPPGYIPAPLRPAQPTALDPTGMANPAAIGAGENPTSVGFLTQANALSNPFHLQITLAPGDPLVINNNLPFVRVDAPSFAYWSASRAGTGGSPSSNLDGDSTPDLLEYAFQTDPTHGLVTSPRYQVLHHAGTGRFRASYTLREQGHADVSVRVQVLQNLTASPASWVNATAAPTSASNGNGSRTLTLADLEAEPGFSGLEFGFVRFLVSLDADLNGTPEATAATPVMGWQRRTLPAASTSSWSAALISAPATELSGRITAVSGSSLDLSEALSGQGNFQASSFPNSYVEILDGPHVGHRLLVTSTGSSGTLAGINLSASLTTLSSLPSTLTGSRFIIRPALTLSAAFPPAGFTAALGPTTADRVMVFDNPTQSYTTYWLFTGGGNPFWVREGDGTLANRNSVVLNPEIGTLVQRRGSALTRTMTGFVRANPFALRLANRQNLIGTPWPLAQSPASRNMTTVNGLSGSNQATTADALSVWASDLTPGAPSFASYFLFRVGSTERWVLQGDGSLQDRRNDLLFRAGRAAFWKSINGQPNFVLATPWTP